MRMPPAAAFLRGIRGEEDSEERKRFPQELLFPGFPIRDTCRPGLKAHPSRAVLLLIKYACSGFPAVAVLNFLQHSYIQYLKVQNSQKFPQILHGGRECPLSPPHCQ